jgi:hypothetical protein
MAETIQIDPELLYPGDTIRFDFLIRSASETRKAAALKSIKDTIYSDDRLDYQGSEETFPVDLETGESSHILSVYATVRKYKRNASPEMQKAGIGPFAIVAIVASVSAAVVAWKVDAIYETYAVARVREAIMENPDMTPQEKVAALETLAGEEKGTISGAIQKTGAGVVAVIALLGLFWLLSQSSGER